MCQGNYSSENIFVLNNSVQALGILRAIKQALCAAWLLVGLWWGWSTAFGLVLAFAWEHNSASPLFGHEHIAVVSSGLVTCIFLAPGAASLWLCHSLRDEPGKPRSIISDCWSCKLFGSRNLSASMFYNIVVRHVRICHFETPLPETFLAGKSQPLKCL